jgi:hypothetical protein
MTWLLTALLAAACERGAEETGELEKPPEAVVDSATAASAVPSGAGAPAVSAPAPAASAAATTRAEQIDRASVVAFVNRWAQLQNDGDFAEYSNLYAPDFAGIERVAQTTTAFDKDSWLADRRRMFDAAARVLLSGVEILRADTTVGVVFEQRYSTPSFAERGDKALTLQKAGDQWRIVREEMLAPRVAAPGRRQAACPILLKQLASASAGVRYVANLASAEAATARWASVSSHDDADGRADDGHAWEFWALLHGNEWQVASVSLSSPSGDSARHSSFCFRPDGTLSQVIDSYRTLMSDQGLVEDTVTSVYSRAGVELSSKTDARYLATGKPAQTGAYLRPPPMLVKRAAELPFAALLKQ